MRLIFQINQFLTLITSACTLYWLKMIIYFLIEKCTTVSRAVRNVLTKHYSNLYDTTEYSLQKMANKLFSKSLITREVLKEPTFEKICFQFLSVLNLHENLSRLLDDCQSFLCSLSAAGGPAREVAKKLATDWEQVVFADHNITFNLSQTVLALEKQGTIEVSSSISTEIESLRTKFTVLMRDVKNYYASSKEYQARIIASWVEEHCEIKNLVARKVSTDEVFDELKPYYNLMSIDSLKELINEHPISDPDLQSRFAEYEQDLKKFMASTELQDIKDIKKALEDDTTKDKPKIVLKLSGKWAKQTIKNLWSLMTEVLGEDALQYLTVRIIKDGSVVIHFMVSSSKFAHLLIIRAQSKAQYLSHLGIFQLIINNVMIINKEEDVDFSFEDSLLHVIKQIEVDPEYKRTTFLLISFQLQLNYSDREGKTALILASEGGHINILVSLLHNGADIQQPLTRGFVGLNNLACTAISQHRQKSAIGGERIVSQDGTSVSEMLERASRHSVIDSFLYDSLAHTIEMKLQERWQCLLIRFHLLNNAFIAIASKLIGTRITLAETQQHLRQYIAEEVECDSVQELMESLQPHYSYLNINLLSLMSTILNSPELKEKVDSYDRALKAFKSITSLLELALATKGQDLEQTFVVKNYSILVIKLNKPWGSKSIADLSKLEEFVFQSNASLINVLRIDSGPRLTCTYLLPVCQAPALLQLATQRKVFLYNLGVFYVNFNMQFPVLNENENLLFSFEDLLLKAYQANDESILFFLPEINVSLPATPVAPISETGLHRANEIILLEAIKRRDTEGVRNLLRRGCDVNYISSNDESFLMTGVFTENSDVVQMLLEENVDINHQNRDGTTALTMASAKGYHQIVELLLLSSNIDIRNNNGLTALMAACGLGHLRVVKLLLQKDLDINIQDNSGTTALMFACDNGNHQIVEILLGKKNPDVNVQNSTGSTALMIICKSGNLEIAKLLLLREDLNINIQNNAEMTALMIACVHGYHQIVELLLLKDPDVNFQNNHSLTALIIACINGYHQVVKQLLGKNTDITIKFKLGLSVLMIACHQGHHEMAKLLLSKDQDIDSRNDDGVTALMIACINGHHKVIELLLSKGADLNIQNDGLTALMYACASRHYKAVQTLLPSDKLDINVQNNSGVTALIVASALGNHDLVKLLLQKKDLHIDIRDNEGMTALMFACIEGHEQVVEHLLSKNLDIDIQNKDGWTALMIACQNGSHKVVELLLRRNPNINIQSEQGVTGLMIACHNGHDQVIELLLGRDQNINMQRNDGVTALMIACRMGYRKIVQMLLNRGPDLNIQDKNGTTALMIACGLGRHQIVELLLSKNPNVNIITEEGQSAVAFALAFAHTQARIINEGLLPNQEDLSGLKSLEHLLDHNPNHIHNIKGKEMHSLALAVKFNNAEAMNILMRKCQVTNEILTNAFTEACYTGNSSMMILISGKLTVLSASEQDFLLAAAKGDTIQLVSAIVGNEMSSNTILVNGITPLMVAASSGHYEIVETLITEADANVNIQNNEGFTAQDIAECITNRTDIVNLLIANTPPSETTPIKKVTSPDLTEAITNLQKPHDLYSCRREFPLASSLVNIPQNIHSTLVPVAC